MNSNGFKIALVHIGHSKAGGKSVAIAYPLIETCKLNRVNPEAWLAWVLERI